MIHHDIHSHKAHKPAHHERVLRCIDHYWGDHCAIRRALVHPKRLRVSIDPITHVVSAVPVETPTDTVEEKSAPTEALTPTEEAQALAETEAWEAEATPEELEESEGESE